MSMKIVDIFIFRHYKLSDCQINKISFFRITHDA